MKEMFHSSCEAPPSRPVPGRDGQTGESFKRALDVVQIQIIIHGLCFRDI